MAFRRVLARAQRNFQPATGTLARALRPDFLAQSARSDRGEQALSERNQRSAGEGLGKIALVRILARGFAAILRGSAATNCLASCAGSSRVSRFRNIGAISSRGGARACG